VFVTGAVLILLSLARAFWLGKPLTKAVIVISTFLFLRFVIDVLPVSANTRAHWVGTLGTWLVLALVAGVLISRIGRRPR